jgi:adenosylcobinamide-phosphate synthase
VVWTGKISERLIRPYSSKRYGVLLWLASVLPVLIPLSALWFLPFPYSLLSVYPLKASFSIRMLYEIISKSVPFREESRKYVQQAVRRDVMRASPELVRSAAIETLFESAVDGITSPLFWFLLLGLPGALLQRLANTMDSMVGYKSPELRDQGWFSAKVDTVLNYVPARLTALILVLAGRILGMRPEIDEELKREAERVESPNARVIFLTVASLLKVRLKKEGYYVIGSRYRYPEDEDVKRSLKLFRVALAFYLALEFALVTALSYVSPLLAP